MYSYLKFYAQGAQMKSINMSGRVECLKDKCHE